MNEYIVSAEQEGMRLDIFLTEQMEGSRSYIQSLIKGGHVTVGDKVGKANLRLTPDTVIHVESQSLNRLRLNRGYPFRLFIRRSRYCYC